MKALVVTRIGQNFEMRIEERPKPVRQPGQTLVKMYAAIVNPLSHQIRSGIIDLGKAPIVLSNDGSGIVEESDVFRPGTPVAIFGGAQLGITEDGLQQEWVAVDDKRIIELPASFSLDEGAALPINYVSAIQALTRVGNVCAGQTVIVSGASGSVGHAVIQLTKALGATPIAIVSSAEKVEHAHRSGARDVIDTSSEDLRERVLRLTDGKGADWGFDPVGGDMLGNMLTALCQRGSLVSIGFVGGQRPVIDLADLVIQEKRLLGYDAWLESDESVRHAIARLKAFIDEGKIRPSIDSRHSMANYEAAYARLSSRRATGTILLTL